LLNRCGFSNLNCGVDLRPRPLLLLLFQKGEPSNNLQYEHYKISSSPLVFVFVVSLGTSVLLLAIFRESLLGAALTGGGISSVGGGGATKLVGGGTLSVGGGGDDINLGGGTSSNGGGTLSLRDAVLEGGGGTSSLGGGTLSL